MGKCFRVFELDNSCVQEDDPLKATLEEYAFYVCFKFQTTKEKSPDKLVLGQDMILPI